MRILQVLDHVGIYLVIAGSMTPFMLLTLHHHTNARVLICAEWIAAFFGSIFAGSCPYFLAGYTVENPVELLLMFIPFVLTSLL